VFCRKINYTEIRKQKSNVTSKCCKCRSRSAMQAFTVFLVSDATRRRVPVPLKGFSRRDTGRRRIDKCTPNSFWCCTMHDFKLSGRLISTQFSRANSHVSYLKINKLASKNKVPGSVLQRTLVALVRETSLRFGC
jgi:hypothetical protein